MYLTRLKINEAKGRVQNFFKINKKMGKKSKIYKISKKYCRNKNIEIDYNSGLQCLERINLFYNNIDKHWAETDGIEIWLNIYRKYNDDLLEKTLLHEAFHGIILANGHSIPEYKEHDIMKLIDSKLL